MMKPEPMAMLFPSDAEALATWGLALSATGLGGRTATIRTTAGDTLATMAAIESVPLLVAATPALATPIGSTPIDTDSSAAEAKRAGHMAGLPRMATKTSHL
jgi:hypothetical protein